MYARKTDRARWPWRRLAVVLATFAAAGLAVAPQAAEAEPAADFYVAPNGRDTWSGRHATPVADDGPFATVGRAREAARVRRRAQPNRKHPVVVMLRGGTYALAEPLVLTPEDSGTESAPLVFAAYPTEEPVLSGGVRISGWHVDPQGRWQTELPAVRRGEWQFLQLFVNGERRYRPRLPKQSYYFIEKTMPPSGAHPGRNPDRFQFRPGEIRADWANPDDIDILCFSYWTMERMRIAAVDVQRRVVTFRQPTWSWQFARLAARERFIVENVKEALEQPGEWYLDRPTGVLTYIPLPGERPDTAIVVAPRLETLVEFRGDPGLGMWVEHVALRGLTLAHTQWTAPADGYQFAQAEAGLGAAVTATGARHCALERCRVEHTGAYAVAWGSGCRRNRVTECALADLGAGGVKIGEMACHDPARLAGDNVVSDCVIVHGGRLHPAAVGVWIGDSPENRVEHNDIDDFYYTGVSVGWNWSYGPSNAHHNTVAYNHIHRIGQSVLSDMGGIYTLGISTGTRLQGNFIHDVKSDAYGGWGLYFDASTSGLTAEDNVVTRCKTGGLHHHWGKENVVRNNVFANNGSGGQIIRTRPEEHLSLTFEHNIVYWTDGALFGGVEPAKGVAHDWNLYWRAGGTPFDFAGLDLAQWQAAGQDVHSLVAGPRFAAPERDDFRLQPDSPAPALGFRPLDLAQAGPRHATAARRDAPPAYPHPPPPPPVVAEPIEDGFEDCAAGQAPYGCQISEEPGTGAVIVVTDETAATGQHCLKLVDKPGQEFSYNPHLYYRPAFTGGVLAGRFDLRLEPGAVFYHEWRDWPSGGPLRRGPSLRVEADGTLMVDGRKAAKLPHRDWLSFEIVCGTGPELTGQWELTVRFPEGREPLHLTGLACDPQFKTANWVGFVADGAEATVIYLDNVGLKPQGGP